MFDRHWRYGGIGAIDKENCVDTMGERIRRRRMDLGLSQKDIAKKVNVTRQTVSAWEHGVSQNITGTHLHHLARVLNVSAVWILTGREKQMEASATAGSETLSLIHI